MPLGITIPINGDMVEQGYATKTYYMDWEAGRIRGTVDGAEALHQHIIKTWITPRFRCLIYGPEIGTEHETLIGGSLNDDYIDAELPRMLFDAIKEDDRVLSLLSYKRTNMPGDGWKVECTINTVYGEIDIEEVI